MTSNITVDKKLPTKDLAKSIGILTGPTAVGKSTLAIELARTLASQTLTPQTQRPETQGPRIEIINGDSLLVYRGLNIGTAKPSPQELQEIPHHLVDIRNPDQNFTAGDFVRAAEEAIQEIHNRGNRALIVGGTGFYLKALLFGLWKSTPSSPEIRAELELQTNEELFSKLQNLDPASAERIGPKDRYRLLRGIELIQSTGKTLSQLQADLPKHPDPRFYLWILDRPNSELFRRIEERTRLMLEVGLVDEYQAIQAQFPNCRPLDSIGYAQVRAYLAHESPAGRKLRPGIPGLSDEIQLATRQLAKYQRTWLRNMQTKIPASRCSVFNLTEPLYSLDAPLSNTAGHFADDSEDNSFENKTSRAQLEEAFKRVYE